ncbi:ABC transporter substrate-binding protein [Enteractinococcus coprophilus]|uniref:ABC-type branched-subunit amino acid transport system substrate-binding protein n=1 Tax=Enteractinococcus coprophilus TaxID=1027633 RepID=A0A543ANZ6_9MICC|nr:ABC transporter substrate-binding protein [Enteractinococcus coprophilus]TQL74297.1 ABC-type branched-subunit amino acid transport system substrate-binding protein [Enteractinococcus coprophilus]
MSHAAEELDDVVGEEETGSKRKKRVALLLAIFAGVIVLVLLVGYLVRANANQGPDPVAVTVPIALSEVAPPENAKIGVVLTLGSEGIDGSQWHQAAQGAVVAQERVRLGGNDVELVTEDDLGTASGGVDAVDSLINQGVSGIIYASSGEHVSDGLEAASAAGVPVILPYETVPQGVEHVWSLAPAAQDTVDVLAAEVAEYERPVHINAGTELPEGVDVSDAVTFTVDTNVDDFAKDIALRTGANPYGNGAYTGGGEDEQEPAPVVQNPADAVVVSGSAAMQARVVFALQTGNVSVPILLTDHALSPRFEQTLLDLGGTVSSNLRTIGVPADDGVALGTSGQSRAMSAFLSANRQFAGDESITNLTGDTPLAETAAVADTRGHDAVLAFAEALDTAGGTDPADVAKALGGLHLVAGHGIAGPALDFTQAHAVEARPTVLNASSQRLGLRPTHDEVSDALVWID